MTTHRLTSTLAAALLTAALTGCGTSQSATASHSSAAGTTLTQPTASAPTSGGCRKVAAPTPPGAQHLAAPSTKLDPARTYTVDVVTNCGAFAFTLNVKGAPKTSASVAYLAGRGFFNGLTFHRVAAGFVIQGGDPNGDGSGGPGYQVVESPPANLKYAVGDVAMAKTGSDPAGASGSQFFVVLSPQGASGLTPDYALVGHVISGFSTVQRIGVLPTNPPQDGAPTIPVVMSRVTLTAR